MMAVATHLMMKLDGQTASADFPPVVSLERVHRELTYGTISMVLAPTAWQSSTILFDQLELPEEADVMLRDHVRL